MEHQANYGILSRANTLEHFLKTGAKFLGICEILNMTESVLESRILISLRLGQLGGRAGGRGVTNLAAAGKGQAL